MDPVIQVGAVAALLLTAGFVLGLFQRHRFDSRWLLVAAGLVVLNDVLLTRAYGTLPDLLPTFDRNWQGKLMALAATLAVAALPAFGWRRCGLNLAQRPGSLRHTLPVALLYGAFFVALALAFPNDPPSREEIAFQATMPGLEEELFYRGVLLYALDRAFTGRVRWAGVEWGWGTLLTSALFGLAHAFRYADGGFGFEPLYFAFTALPSLVAVWVRYRTGSLLLPVLMHNAGNSAMTLL